MKLTTRTDPKLLKELTLAKKENEALRQTAEKDGKRIEFLLIYISHYSQLLLLYTEVETRMQYLGDTLSTMSNKMQENWDDYFGDHILYNKASTIKSTTVEDIYDQNLSLNQTQLQEVQKEFEQAFNKIIKNKQNPPEETPKTQEGYL